MTCYKNGENRISTGPPGDFILQRVHWISPLLNYDFFFTQKNYTKIGPFKGGAIIWREREGRRENLCVGSYRIFHPLEYWSNASTRATLLSLCFNWKKYIFGITSFVMVVTGQLYIYMTSSTRFSEGCLSVTGRWREKEIKKWKGSQVV